MFSDEGIGDPKTEEDLQKFNTNSEFIVTTMVCTFTKANVFSFITIGENSYDPNLIHFIICYLFVGLPLTYMQVIIGQYSQLSETLFQHICPIGHGVGYTLLLEGFLWICFSGITMSDIVMYLLSCTQKELFWVKCPVNSSHRCWDIYSDCRYSCLNQNVSMAAYVYWNETFMKIVNTDARSFNIDTPIAARIVPLLVIWSLVYWILTLDVNTQKKIIRFIFSSTWILTIIILFLSCITKGASIGMIEMFYVKSSSLYNISAWISALNNVLFCLQLGKIFHILHGSYMNISMPADMLVLIEVFFNFTLTALSTLTCYAILGGIAKAAYITDLTYVWKTGFSPVFTVVPQGLSFLGIPQIWSALFFLSMLLIVLGNLITQTDGIQNCIVRAHITFKIYKTYVIAILCIMLTFYSLIFSTKESFPAVRYITKVVIPQTQSLTLFLITLIVFWIYSVKRFCDDIHFIHGSQPTKYWKVCWYIMPCILGFNFFYLTFVDEKPEVYNPMKTVCVLQYILLILPIPVLIIYEIFHYLKLHNFAGILQPEERWGPPDKNERHLRHMFNPRQEIRSRRRDDTCHHPCLLKNALLRNNIKVENQIRNNTYSEENRLPETTERSKLDLKN